MKNTPLGRTLPTLVTLVLLALFIYLGVWQLDRANKKEQLQQKIQQHRASAATVLQLPSFQSLDKEAWQYHKVRIAGRFDTQHQYLLDNRIYRGRAGFQVLTLLHAQGKSILVNRGWIKLNADRNQLPLLKTSSGPVSLSGRLMPIGRPGPLLGSAGYSSSQWPKIIQQVDVKKIRAQIDSELIPAIVQLDEKDAACYVCDWPVQRGGMSADRHRAYALQWFSMALALLYLYLTNAYRKRSREKR